MVVCPECGLSVAASGRAELETHLRLDLDYTPLRCKLCRLHFPDLPAARLHFASPLSPHLNTEPALVETRLERAELRIHAALQAAFPRTLTLDAERSDSIPLSVGTEEEEEAEWDGGPKEEKDTSAFENMSFSPSPVKTSENENTKVRPCGICKAMIHITKRSRHIYLVHMKQKPFMCTICDFSSTEMASQRRHSIAKHADEDTFKDRRSDKTFATAVNRFNSLCFYKRSFVKS